MSWQIPDVTEPTLAETLADPIVQQLMLSDGVTPAEVLGVMAEARQSLRRESRQGSPSGTYHHH